MSALNLNTITRINQKHAAGMCTHEATAFKGKVAKTV